MNSRFRARVWRELPYSARKAILGVLRTLDRWEAACHHFWQTFRQSLEESPLWLLVAILGLFGFLLTLWTILTIRPQPSVPSPAVHNTTLRPFTRNDLDSRIPERPSSLPDVPALSLAVDMSREPNIPNLAESWTDSLPSPQLSAQDLHPIVTWHVQRFNHFASVESESVVPLARLVLNMTARPVEPIDLSPKGWFAASATRNQSHELPEYQGDALLLLQQDLEATTEDELPTTHGAEHQEVHARIRWEIPQSTTVGIPSSLRLHVQNVGSNRLSELEVREDVSTLSIVTMADPPAAWNHQDLVRRRLHLRQGEEQTFHLTWIAPSIGSQRYAAAIRLGAEAHSRINVLATPPVTAAHPNEQTHPELQPLSGETRSALRRGLACRIAGNQQSEVNAIIEWQVIVENTGEALLRDVRIWSDVPSNLEHRFGPKLEYRVGDLAPGASKVAVFRALTRAAGLTAVQFRAFTPDQIEALAEALLWVRNQSQELPLPTSHEDYPSHGLGAAPILQPMNDLLCSSTVNVSLKSSVHP
ncbi:MAG: hypothetical protein KatS3mg113_0333 [Planctomycetaceae bacterium]|nr:MAG: hypothetical protein KatS3mg113_0333 [Planctomycetaceae bacterium]